MRAHPGSRNKQSGREETSQKKKYRILSFNPALVISSQGLIIPILSTDCIFYVSFFVFCALAYFETLVNGRKSVL
jgi:hypothetical protein